MVIQKQDVPSASKDVHNKLGKEGNKKTNAKLKDLKIELLKQNAKRSKIRKEIARLLTKNGKEDEKK